MIVLRFKLQCRPDQANAMNDAMRDVVAASRALPGVIHFDVGRDVGDPNAFIATEVFEDKAARAASGIGPRPDRRHRGWSIRQARGAACRDLAAMGCDP